MMSSFSCRFHSAMQQAQAQTGNTSFCSRSYSLVAALTAIVSDSSRSGADDKCLAAFRDLMGYQRICFSASRSRTPARNDFLPSGWQLVEN